jgi:hypothetical protein
LLIVRTCFCSQRIQGVVVHLLLRLRRRGTIRDSARAKSLVARVQSGVEKRIRKKTTKTMEEETEAR